MVPRPRRYRDVRGTRPRCLTDGIETRPRHSKKTSPDRLETKTFETETTTLAARAVLRCPRRAGLTQLIHKRLHWLPMPERITFKLATLAYKCISGWAPDYLAGMCTGVKSVEARARLHSAAAGKLLQPTTDTVTVGRRGFYYAGPATWNSLPSHLTDISMSLSSFSQTVEDIAFSLITLVYQRLSQRGAFGTFN